MITEAQSLSVNEKGAVEARDVTGDAVSGERFGNLVELSEEAQAGRQQTRQTQEQGQRTQGQGNVERGGDNRKLAITEIEFYKAANW